MPAPVVLASVAGAALGSFLNVIIHRLPERRAPLGRSRCPACDSTISAYDNVPVVSWLLLRGRCRRCQARISPRYPLVELSTAVLFGLIVLLHGASPRTWLGLALVAILVPAALIDLEHRLIPNPLVLAGAVAGLVVVIAVDRGALAEHLVAGAGAFAFLLAAALAYPAGMGMGDVKLAGVMGLFLGVAVVPALLTAFVAGTLVGVALLARHGAAARKQGVPFGPFLALGGLVGVLAGPELVDAYSRAFLG